MSRPSPRCPRSCEGSEPVEIFHEVLEHRWFLCEAAGRDVGREGAAASYVDNVLRFAPQERTVLPTDTGQIAPIDPRVTPD